MTELNRAEACINDQKAEVSEPEAAKTTEVTVWSCQRPYTGVTSLPELSAHVHMALDLPFRRDEPYAQQKEWLRPKGVTIPAEGEGAFGLLRVDPGALIDGEVVWSLVAITRPWGYEYDVRGSRPGFPLEFQVIARLRSQKNAWKLLGWMIGDRTKLPALYERKELLRAAGVCGRPQGKPKGVFCRHCGGRL